MTSAAPLVAALVAVVLLTVTFPIARRLATQEDDPRLLWVVMGSTVLRFGCTVLQVIVVKSAYGGVADYTGYVNRGARLAADYRAGDFSLGTGRTVADQAVNVVTGAVFTVIGTHHVAAFVVFSWFATLGLIAFYRAFRVGAPGCDHFRYAVLLFFLPSLLFWPAVVGKEALMIGLLGVAAHGAARLLTARRGGLPRLVVALGLAAVIRPHEALLFFGAFFVAFLLRRQQQRGPLGGISKAAFIAVFVIGGFFLLRATASFAHISSLNVGGFSNALHRTNAGNAGSGAGFGSSGFVWSSSPLHYPQDVYTVLFDPLPFQAHSITQLLASAENVVLLAVLVLSVPRLRILPRAVFARPFVAMALVYTLGFLYLFAALGNLGLIERERTMLFPMLLVLVSLPRYRRPAPSRTPWAQPAAAEVAAPPEPVSARQPIPSARW